MAHWRRCADCWTLPEARCRTRKQGCWGSCLLNGYLHSFLAVFFTPCRPGPNEVTGRLNQREDLSALAVSTSGRSWAQASAAPFAGGGGTAAPRSAPARAK